MLSCNIDCVTLELEKSCSELDLGQGPKGDITGVGDFVVRSSLFAKPEKLEPYAMQRALESYFVHLGALKH